MPTDDPRPSPSARGDAQSPSSGGHPPAPPDESLQEEVGAEAADLWRILDPRLLAEALPQFVWISDADGRVEYVNGRWTDYTGQTVEQTGRHNDGVIHPEDAPVMWERWDSARRAGSDYEVEFRCRRASDGVYRWFLARGVPVKDAQGHVVRWVGTSTDIEERKRAEAEIATLSRRLHRAVFEATHRAKNHFQVLASTIDITLMEGRELIPADELRRVIGQIRTLSALQDVLTVEWKVDAAGGVERISVKALLERVLHILQQAASNAQIRFEVQETTLPVKAATAVALVINEAVTNAIKHAGRNVEVAFEVEVGRGRLEVRDDGPGFPAGFDPKRAANTGLDLIASLVGFDLEGTVTFGNRASGGARVLIEFPLPEMLPDEAG